MKTVWKFLKWVLLVIVGLAIVAVVGFAAFLAYDANANRATVKNLSNTAFAGANGQTLSGYLARPANASAQKPGPAVLMLHEFFGMTDDINKKADLLAAQGYTVLVPDLYRGQTTTQVARAIWLVLSTPQQSISADLDSAYRYLAELPGVDTQRIGVVGFCFGGSQAMRLGTRNPGLRANVIYYGSGPIVDPGELGELGKSGPVLGIFGALDNSIPLSQVNGFKLAMDARRVSNTITVYPGVGHAFVNSRTLAEPGPAREAWSQMLDFLKQNLEN
jgi:carboxymethylenebutenolidase